MAGTNNGNAAGNGQYSMTNVDFNDPQRNEISDWNEHRQFDSEDVLITIADSGYKVSFSYDAYNAIYVGSLTKKRARGNRESIPVYLIRHDDFNKLFCAVHYFFIVLLDKGEKVYQSGGGHTW